MYYTPTEPLFKEAKEKCKDLGLDLRFSKLYEIYVVEKSSLNIVRKYAKGFKTLEEVIEYCENQKVIENGNSIS